MSAIIKFIKISPFSVFVLTIISLFSGLLKSLSILLIIPLMNLFSIETNNNFVFKYFSMLLNYFKIEYNLGNTLLFIFFTSLFAAMIIYFSMYIFQKILISIVVKQREMYLKKFTNIRWEKFNKLKSGEIINAANEQAAKGYLGGMMDTTNLISYSIQAIVMLIISFVISPFFSLLAIIAGLISYLFFALVDKPIVKYSNEIKDYTKIYIVKLSETFHIIKSLVTMNKLGYWNNQINLTQKNLAKSMYKLYLYMEFPVQFREPFAILMLALLLYIILGSQITDLPTIATLLILFQRIQAYFGKAQSLYQAVLKMEVYYDDFNNSKKFLEENTNDISFQENIEMNETIKFEEAIKFVDVSLNYDKVNVIKKISFTIKKGSIFLLKGESGKGKTSLIDIIVGLIKPNSGLVEVDKINLNNLNLHEWRNKISYLSQKPELFNSTLEDNITFFNNDQNQEKLKESIRLSGVGTFIDNLDNGLKTNVGEFGNKLSGGQKQRVAISRLINLEKEIFILDEPTSSLDDKSENIILNLVGHLKTLKKTIIIISHSSKFDALADDIFEI